MVGDTEVNLCTSDVTFLDYESCVKGLKSDLASYMHCKYHICQCLAVLEAKGLGHSIWSSNSNSPFRATEGSVAGERETPYIRLSTHHQLVHWTGGPPREENREYWTGEGSVDHPLRLITIEDVIVDPSPSLSKEGEYHEAPVESGGITKVDNNKLDKVEERPSCLY